MNHRILVVDDNPVNLRLATAILESSGYQIVTAVDAETAQKLIESSAFDLILMDIALPGMDGLTLTRMLKSDSRTRHIPIVALTAFAMKGDDQKAAEAGCDGYIIKPIKAHSFSEEVSTYFLRSDN